jgi:membrane-bound lytic murein transglycosylase D
VKQKKSNNFLAQIKRIKEADQKSPSVKEVPAKKATVKAEAKTPPNQPIIKKNEVNNVPKVVASTSIKPKRSELKIAKAKTLIPPKKFEEVTIASNPKEGIIVDESVVDEFKEDYKPLAEKDGYKETEESIISEELKSEVVPEGDIELDLIQELEDKEARKEFEELQKLKDIKDIQELDELKKAEKLEELLGSEDAKYDVPIVVNRRVEYFLKYFKKKRMKKIFAKWLNRSTKYLPMMRRIFEEQGLPKDLTYLAMIESGFNTHAYSRARAVGPWQFIRGTGKKFNLRIDHWVDERRDPEKATLAAAQYLKQLYGMFGSWYLAAAAYNAGEGRVGRGIKKYKTDDFWELSKYKYLKRETKNYVPKFLAATLISKDPEKYGFNNVKELPVYEYDSVKITEPTDLEVIAKSAGVRLSKVKELNPELRRWYTPPERKSYTVKIPKGSKKTFLANYSKLKPSEKISFLTYRIKYGETLSHVARRFGTSVAAIKKTNKIRSSRYVRAGVELTIPIRGGTKVASYKKAYKSKIDRSNIILVPKGETVPYKVRRGDTLWEIAERSGVKVTDIIKLNDLKNSKIYPGKKILLYKEPKKVYKAAKAKSVKKAKVKGDPNFYTVKSGDSLWTISQKFNVSIRELKRMNNFSRRRTVIKPNQKIRIARAAKSNQKNSIQVASVSRGLKQGTYKVKRGDTLWEIAKKHNMGISEIKSLNNLRSNKIKPGDTLKIK